MVRNGVPAAAIQTKRHPATARQTPSRRRWRTDVSTAPPFAPRHAQRDRSRPNIGGLGCLFVWIAGVAALSPPCLGALRTDFLDGSITELAEGIHTKLFTLPDDRVEGMTYVPGWSRARYNHGRV